MKSAPRIDPRLIQALSALDDPREPMAETRRRLGALAESLDLPRPSYERVRQLVRAHRCRPPRRTRADVVADLAFNTASAKDLIEELLVGEAADR